MEREIEISTLDLRYESYRMQNFAEEKKLLGSIMENGIKQPIEGVDLEGGSILLNGFKRYRCAQKLSIGIVPYISLGKDEAMGIISFLHLSNKKQLNILEQARFVYDLTNIHNMNLAEIQEHLGKSKSWISMRIGLIKEMTENMRDKIFSGGFPVYSYMYTLRRFMRMKGVKKSEIEEFMLSVSGKKLSIREIEQLAHCYFRGPELMREQIKSGKIALSLKQIREVPNDPNGCNEFERVLLNDLQSVKKIMQRVMGKSLNSQISNRTFYAEANLLTADILSLEKTFFPAMRELYDRSGQA